MCLGGQGKAHRASYCGSSMWTPERQTKEEVGSQVSRIMARKYDQRLQYLFRYLIEEL